MTTEIVHFDKYDQRGAYHWEECNPYARNYNPPLAARYEVVAREVRKRAPVERVLDIGCGDGYLLGRVCECANEVVGIDSEPRAIELANQYLQDRANCSVYNGDCYHLPFNDSSFDVALLTDVIEHLAEPRECLEEIQRILRPSGVLIVTTPKWRADRMWDDRHEKEYKAAELRSLLAESFSQVSMSSFWPMRWSRCYSTRLGWKAIKYMARYASNPFLREGPGESERFGQLKAVCSVGQTVSVSK